MRKNWSYFQVFFIQENSNQDTFFVWVMYTNKGKAILWILNSAGSLAKFPVIVKDVFILILLSHLPFKKKKSVLHRNKLIDAVM